MNFKNILTNKYFLYLMVVIATTNVFGLLVKNNSREIIFFILSGLLTYQFSKNMTVVLLVAVILTNIISITMPKAFEGFEGASDSDPEPQTPAPADEAPAIQNIDSKDPVIARALPLVKQAKTNEEIKNKIKSNAVVGNKIPIGMGEKIRNNKGKTNQPHKPRIDYAATIAESYQNLDDLLGSDSINKLTSDTQQLMKQQQNLFNSMNQMVPVLAGAQDMLKTLNLGGLANSLKTSA